MLRGPKRASVDGRWVVSCCILRPYEQIGRRHVRFVSQDVLQQRVTTHRPTNFRTNGRFRPMHGRCKPARASSIFGHSSRTVARAVGLRCELSKSRAAGRQRVPMYGIAPGPTSPGIGHPPAFGRQPVSHGPNQTPPPACEPARSGVGYLPAASREKPPAVTRPRFENLGHPRQ